MAAGIAGSEAALAAAVSAIEVHFWSDAEGCALEAWNLTSPRSEAYRGANSNMHSVEAYLAAGDVTGNLAWHARAASIAARLIDQHARANSWRVPEHYDEEWRPQKEYNVEHPDDQFRPYGTTPGHSFESPAAADPGGRAGRAAGLAAGSGNRALRYGRRRR